MIIVIPIVLMSSRSFKMQKPQLIKITSFGSINKFIHKSRRITNNISRYLIKEQKMEQENGRTLRFGREEEEGIRGKRVFSSYLMGR